MEKISCADTVIFDKTGTLTRACPTVVEVVPFNGEDGREMLRMAACLEEHFPHSVANAVVQEALRQGLEHQEMHSEVEYVVAHGIDDHRAEVLPEDKSSYIASEHEAGRTVIMIGDGINDAPALSLADVGIAVGSGAVIAREAADVTISAEDLRELAWLKRLSDALMRRIDRNYRFVMGFNGALILLGAFGVLAPSVSALLHNTSTVLLSMDCLTGLLDEEEV
ncbi:MAG: HAD-IC family P-type ATPase [Firmicutes bacterium]|nr:HAD-IC family P-type ATPase [Bacillota bacterium]